MGKLTHVDDKGKATMVDVSEKSVSSRLARASGHITLEPSTIELINRNSLKKGDVLTVAQIAGINAAKQTSGLIPLCHNILLDNVKVEAETDETGVLIHSEVVSTGRTGVEMEALTAVSVALLTVYDMCKAADKNMVIDFIRLDYKEKHETA
ncbi:MAG: cyclic pyranopterin monophosphate synthase MoaC [Bacteroidales bacterium]